jgi:photosystem II stability/assembly factor-like uncharacterized protein
MKTCKKMRSFLSAILLFISIHSNAQWTLLDAGVNTELGAVMVDDASTYWVGAMNGILLKTTDGGENWETLVIIGAGDLGKMIRLDANTLVMLADDDLVARSTDNGENWELIPTGAPHVLYDITNIGDLLWASGRDGGIVHSTDGGQTWTVQNSGTIERLHGIDALDASTLMIVGRDGVVLRTTNGGATWEPSTSPVQDDLSSIIFLDDVQQTGLIAGPPAEIFRSTDGGSNWTSVAYSSILEIGDFAAEDAEVVYGVGDGGIILRSMDQGASWEVMTSGVTEDLFAIDVKDSVAVAVGNAGTILKLGISTSTAINENGQKNNLNVFPNPTKGPVTITWDMNATAFNNMSLELYTSDGRLVDRTSWPNGKRTAHIEELQPGNYIVCLTSNGQRIEQRNLVVTGQ